MQSSRDIRGIPVVLIRIFGLAVLKVAGLVIDGGYVFDYQPQTTKRSWAQETFNFPGGNKTDPADITGAGPREAQGGGRQTGGQRAGSREVRRRRRVSRPEPAGVCIRARDS